ncbi:snoRNA binding protein [Aureococcus anophagefferens]|nr:snoRNA binding protein [Aureococcus anophagefferens]
MSDEEQPRLPDYFPLAPKGCAKQANAFFECFAAAGAQAPDTACMSWWVKRNSMPEIYRAAVAARPESNNTMKLKHHESKLLRKVDFLQWKSDNTLREAQVTSMVAKLKALKPDDAQREELSELLLRKLFAMGLVDSDAGLAKAEKVSVSAFCRRRLPVILVRLKMAQSVKEAVSFVERGDVRVGPTVITDSASSRGPWRLRAWAGDASQRRHIAKYNNKLDDDLLRVHSRR